MSINAMKQALEALETEQALRHGYSYRAGVRIVSTADEAINLLRTALQQAGSESVYQIRGDIFDCPHAWRDATEEAFYVTPVSDRRILYTRHAPGVPEKLTVDPSGVSGTADEGYVAGWNACRAAITQADAKTDEPVQADSSEYLRVIASLGAALRRLSFAAQTTGGTTGPDAELQSAIGQAEQALSLGGIGQAMFATGEPVGRVRIDSGEVHIVPRVRDAEASSLTDGQSVYTTPQPAQTTQAEVTDEQIESCALEAGFSVESTGSIWAVDGYVGTRVDPGLRKFAKAILALRPVAVPMTDEQRNDMICTVTTLCAKLSRRAIVGMAIDWTEAHHGITAKTEGGK